MYEIVQEGATTRVAGGYTCTMLLTCNGIYCLPSRIVLCSSYLIHQND